MRYQLVTGSEPTAFLGTLQATHARSGIERLRSRARIKRERCPIRLECTAGHGGPTPRDSLSACCRAASPKSRCRPPEADVGGGLLPRMLSIEPQHVLVGHRCECRSLRKYFLRCQYTAGNPHTTSMASLVRRPQPKHSTVFAATSGGQSRDVHARNLGACPILRFRGMVRISHMAKSYPLEWFQRQRTKKDFFLTQSMKL